MKWHIFHKVDYVQIGSLLTNIRFDLLQWFSKKRVKAKKQIDSTVKINTDKKEEEPEPKINEVPPSPPKTAKDNTTAASSYSNGFVRIQ